MTVPLDQFVSRLADSGLMTVADVQAFVESLPVDEQPQDAEQVLRALVQGKRLTNWQARQIGAGDGQSLVLGNYVILDKLGQGGMGEVFKAQHQRMQRVVALKILSPQVTGNPEALKRFQREVVAAARLLHPNVVAAYDADEAKGTHFLVMEHVPGRDLGRLVRETGVLSVAQALRCIVQAARGLEYAHSQGVVHRDVKPSNLLLDATGVVKVLDLGLARIESAAGQPHDITSTGDILGTVDFMAPEQAENTKSADARSDVYSLGMTLWFLLTGRPGYERDSLASKIMAHRTAPIPPLREARPEVSKELEAVFQKLVAKDPRERYQTMTEVIAALEDCIVEAASTVQTSSDDNELAVRLSSISRREMEEETLVFITPAVESTRPGASAPTLPMQPSALARSERSRTPLAIALAFLGGAAVILLTIFLLRPPRGDNVLVEVTDPEVAVNIDSGAVTIVGAASKKLRLREGEHELAVKRGETELAETFTVAKGKSTTLEIEVVDGVLRVKQDGQVLGQIALAKPPGAAPVLPAGKFVLEFAPGNKVEIGSLKLDRNGELTLEAYVTPHEAADGKPGVLLGTPQQFALHLDPSTNRLSLASQHDDGAHRVGPIEIQSGRRTHVAAVRAANEHRLYVEGICVGREKIASPLTETAESFTMGGQFAGAIEELRISSTARYDEAFAPTERLEPDGETLALYHVSDGGGDTLVDSSGHDHSGKIVGAKWVEVDRPPTVEKSKFALRFDSTSMVTLPKDRISEIVAGLDELTVEAVVTCEGERRTFSIFQTSGQFSMVYDGYKHPEGGWGFYSFGNFEVAARAPWEPGRKVHLAGVQSKTKARLYLDGRELSSADITERKAVKGNGDAIISPPNIEGLRGSIEQLRISSTVRYEQDFIPVYRFPRDSQTVALYQFDEGQGDVLGDSSGNGHHGKIVGAKWVRAEPTVAPPTPSEFALEFDGQDDEVLLGGIKSLDPPMTVEAWASSYSANQGHLFYCGAPHWLTLETYGQRWAFSTVTAEAKASSASAGGVFELGNAYHVAGTWNGTQSVLFVNGARQPLPAEALAWKSGRNEIATLGGLRNGYHFRGRLRELRVSKSLRYEKDFIPEKRFQSDADTLAVYHFDEGSGEALMDSSGNNLHGQIKGARWVKADDKPPPFDPSFFNNKDLAGWAGKEGVWTSVHNGQLVGAVQDVGSITYLCGKKPYKDFELSLQVGLVGAGARAGVLFRGSLLDQTAFTMVGPQCEIGTGNAGWGGLGKQTEGLGKVLQAVPQTTYEKLVKPDEFNNLTLRCVGNKVTITLNGTTTVDGEFPIPDEGLFGLQLASGGEPAELKLRVGRFVDLSKPAAPAVAPPPAIAPFDGAQAKAHQEAWAKHLGVPVEYTNSIGMKFVLIPPGEFIMGSTPEEIEEALPVSGAPDYWNVRTRSEGPQHRVILTRPVFAGVHEVTQRQYETVMKRNPSHFAATGAGRDLVAELDTHDHPVESASWNDAAEFCIRLSGREQLKPCYSRTASHVTNLSGDGYRLPMEAQWEFAVRAGTTSKFWSGDRAEALPQIAWNGSTSGGRPHAVGQLRANPFGLFDVYGNVAEWVQDRWHADHFEGLAHATTVDPEGSAAGDPYRALRGGDWLMSALYCRSATRNSWVLGDSAKYFGFRVALSVEAVRTATAPAR